MGTCGAYGQYVRKADAQRNMGQRIDREARTTTGRNWPVLLSIRECKSNENREIPWSIPPYATLFSRCLEGNVRSGFVAARHLAPIAGIPPGRSTRCNNIRRLWTAPIRQADDRSVVTSPLKDRRRTSPKLCRIRIVVVGQVRGRLMECVLQCWRECAAARINSPVTGEPNPSAIGRLA